MGEMHVVLIVVHDDFQLLGLARPVEVLSGATRFGVSGIGAEITRPRAQKQRRRRMSGRPLRVARTKPTDD